MQESAHVEAKGGIGRAVEAVWASVLIVVAGWTAQSVMVTKSLCDDAIERREDFYALGDGSLIIGYRELTASTSDNTPGLAFRAKAEQDIERYCVRSSPWAWSMSNAPTGPYVPTATPTPRPSPTISSEARQRLRERLQEAARMTLTPTPHP